MSSSDLKDESLTYVGLNRMLLNITNELPMEECFKDNLLANLYFTVEFLKKELEEKNYVIKYLLTRNLCCCKIANNHVHEIVETNVNNVLNPEVKESQVCNHILVNGLADYEFNTTTQECN